MPDTTLGSQKWTEALSFIEFFLGSCLNSAKPLYFCYDSPQFDVLIPSGKPLFQEFKLNKQLIKAIDKLGFNEPTPVQQQAIPEVQGGRDIMVCAETGSGKSAAFLLPILERMLSVKAPNSGTRALVLVPTRELARQLAKQCEKLAQFTKIESGLITGGAEFKYQTAIFRKNPEIIIATPGRLVDHLGKQKNLMEDVEVLVLDEADRMLDMGFEEDVLKIAEACGQRQTLLFSATMNQKGIRHMIKQVLNDPIDIVVDSFRGAHSTIQQQRILADDDKHKERLLTWLLSNEEYRQAIVFVNTKAKSENLYHYLEYHNVNSGVLHGDMTQDERNHIMQRMRQGQITVLVATDVAARGLDVQEIDLVINVDMPRSGDDYVHRIGRTGRAGNTGLAISLVDNTEWNLKAAIERYLQIEMESRTIGSLKAKYKGPKKVKSNGKAAGNKKKKDDKKKPLNKKAKEKLAKKKEEEKSKRSNKKYSTESVDGEPSEKEKSRHRFKKNIGKRRKPKSDGEDKGFYGDGSAPFKLRKNSNLQDSDDDE